MDSPSNSTENVSMKKVFDRYNRDKKKTARKNVEICSASTVGSSKRTLKTPHIPSMAVVGSSVRRKMDASVETINIQTKSPK